MANTFKRVFSFGKIPVRPLGLPAMGTKVVDGRVLTSMVLNQFGRFLVILNEPGRTVHHVGKDITERQLLQCRASGDFKSFLAADQASVPAPVAAVPAPAPEPAPEPVEEPAPEAEVETPAEVEEAPEEPAAEEKPKPAKKKRASRKKKAKVEEVPEEEAPVEESVEEAPEAEAEKTDPLPDPLA